MVQKLVAILIIIFFLIGCTKQSTIVNVNLPPEDKSQLVNTVLGNSSNVNIVNNTSVNTNKNINSTTVNTNTNKPTIVPTQVEIPAKLDLDVAFAPQAPFGNWNVLNEEACEEASMITVAKYFLTQPLSEKIMEAEIIKLDNWEKSHGYKIDLSAAETANVLKEYFNLKAKVVEDVSIDRIKYELSLGNLIIVPLAGRELNNPYFQTPGPIYHMLVIRGYDNDEFITNEVGTKRGDGFKYKYQVLINAIHDWNPTWSHYEVTDAQMTSQPKRMIIISQ